MNINEANNLDENVFFEIFKNIYEHSDFITKLVQKKRPFKKKSEIINHFHNIFDSLDKDTKVNIIKSHPDLGDKLKIKEGLTNFSQDEQSKAGLAECTDEEFNELNLKKELIELINAGLSLSAASKYLAKKKNLTKNLIYNLY